MQEEFAFKECIEKNFGALKSGVKMSTVANFLIEKGVLKLAEWRKLKSMEIEEDERTEYFLFDLHDKSDSEFKIFIEALRNNGQEEMASTLEITYSDTTKKCAEEKDLSNRLESLHRKGIQAQAPMNTKKKEKSNTKEETMMEKKTEEQRMAENVTEKIRMTDAIYIIDKIDTNVQKVMEEQKIMRVEFQNMKEELGTLRAEIQRKEEENRWLTEENKRLNSKIEEQNKEIDSLYLQLEQLECDRTKNVELAQKYEELLEAKEKIDSDHNQIVESVSSFELKFSEIMGKKISFENTLLQLEVHLRKEQKNKTSLLKELEEKTQASQNVAQLKVEIENLRRQELEMRRNKEEMERKVQDLTKAKNALKFQYDILHVKYNREKKEDKVVPFTKY